MLYFSAFGAGFAVDTVDADFDVDEYDSDPEDRKKMKPWEVRNALAANERREMVLRWLKSAGAGEKSVTDKSIPKTPDWQSEER